MPKHHGHEDDLNYDNFEVVRDTAILPHPDEPNTSEKHAEISPTVKPPPLTPQHEPARMCPLPSPFEFPALPQMPSFHVPPPPPLYDPIPTPVETAVLLGIAYVLGGVTGALLVSAFSKASTGVCQATIAAA